MTEHHPAASSPAPRPQFWRLRTRLLDLSGPPLLMGIVNVTPDSFSDGGKWSNGEAALRHALQLVTDGADILDLGGESTRPYSEPVSLDEELNRVIPVLERLAAETSVPLSIDTSKAAVAAAAIKAGAEIINDVTALHGDPQMLEIARQSQAGICAMHMQGTPQTMQDNPHYEDVVAEIVAYLAQTRDWLINQGITRDRICLDPGIGFGKTHEHNLTLLKQIAAFHQLGAPLLVGHSRKGFIGKLLGGPDRDRDAGTLGLSLHLADQGVQVIRVHEVARTRDALTTFWAGRS
ncbi:MAG: dihydropteroate synthase [Planctomycetota bacterium]